MAKIREKGLVAKKIGMTRVFDNDGNAIPVTLLKVEAQTITKMLTPEKEGYHGFQIGYFEKREKRLSKADIHRLRKVEIQQNYARFKEFRTEAALEGLQVGSQINADWFEGVAQVDVTGITKGRGFQGAVKRWGATIGRMTHGSRFHRRPGSLGTRSTPGRVFKNKPQPGHMGCAQRTIKNLLVVNVDKEANVIAVKGSVPGYGEGYVELRPSLT